MKTPTPPPVAELLAAPESPVPGLQPRPLAKLAATRRSASGFTLLEIMMVVAIIALLVATGIHEFGGSLDFANEVKIKGDIQAMSTQLKLYQAQNGFLPTTQQGLDALVSPPTSEPRPTQWHSGCDKLPLDPWNQKYFYVQPGKHNANSFDIYSSGKDRMPGTADDIGNWDKAPTGN